MFQIYPEVNVMGTDSIGLIIFSAVFGMVAVFCFYTAYRHHREKGFIFTNRWLFSSLKAREHMDEITKKAEYRIGRNIFTLTGLIFLLIAIYVITYLPWLIGIVYALIMILIFYGFLLIVKLVKSIIDKKF